MRMQLKSMLFLVGVSFLLFAGFKNPNVRSINAELKGQPTEVNIEFVYTGVNADGDVTGTYTAHGGIESSGTSEMTVHRYANVAHCSQTLEAAEGTITILSNCQFSTMTGAWRVVSGTGAYSDLQGNGKLLMTFPGGGIFVRESYSGKVR